MDWRDTIGKYVTWPDNEWVELTFLHEEPRDTVREFKGQKKDAKEWDVEVNGTPKILQVSSFRFLKQLANIPKLTAKPIKVKRTGTGIETKYTVATQKTLK